MGGRAKLTEAEQIIAAGVASITWHATRLGRTEHDALAEEVALAVAAKLNEAGLLTDAGREALRDGG